jgi:hypothetical protein
LRRNGLGESPSFSTPPAVKPETPGLSLLGYSP